ncbi:MAG TPA: hypothetical protein VL463_20000 [Kofleriaceae bacterium]|nr:hypothetical protein [Kofleriaceae bacterium]
MSAIVGLAVCTSATAFADHHHHHDRYRGHSHAVYMRTPRVQANFRFDSRPFVQIQADPRFHVAIRGYHPHHHWARFHIGRAGWLRTWNVTSYNDVSTITCEAVDRDTGRRYPVSATRGNFGWRENADMILDQALDECYADGGGAACTPVQPACMVQQ